jgi:hypothetical protein
MKICVKNICGDGMLPFLVRWLENEKLITIIVLFVETPRKFITAKLSIRKPGSSSVLIICDLFNSHALFICKTYTIYVNPDKFPPLRPPPPLMYLPLQLWLKPA